MKYFSCFSPTSGGISGGGNGGDMNNESLLSPSPPIDNKQTLAGAFESAYLSEKQGEGEGEERRGGIY